MTVTPDMWYIDEGFLVWIILLTYQSRKSIIWAYITSFVHTYIHHMFSVSITCLIYLSPVYVYLYSLYHFSCMFPIQIHWYTCIYLISNLLSFHLCYLSLPVPVCLSHLTWSCTRVTAWARQLALSYVLAGCIWQPWILMSRSWCLDRGGFAVADQSGAA